jgi:hypothetical protein
VEGFTAGAHARHDPLTGELHSLSYMVGRDFVQHIVTGVGGDVVRSTTIPMTRTPFMHDFALTENHVVLWDTPLGFDGYDCRWLPEHPTRVGVMPGEETEDIHVMGRIAKAPVDYNRSGVTTSRRTASTSSATPSRSATRPSPTSRITWTRRAVRSCPAWSGARGRRR